MERAPPPAAVRFCHAERSRSIPTRSTLFPFDAGLKPDSSTELTTSTAREAAVVAGTAGTAVEERPFQGRVKNHKKRNNTALPKAAAEVGNKPHINEERGIIRCS